MQHVIIVILYISQALLIIGTCLTIVTRSSTITKTLARLAKRPEQIFTITFTASDLLAWGLVWLLVALLVSLRVQYGF